MDRGNEFAVADVVIAVAPANRAAREADQPDHEGHCVPGWDQGEAGKAAEKQAFVAMHNPVHMRKFGIPSTWFETFHTYGCKITETDTIYYCDNLEVGRHATLPLSRQKPFFFLINLATGGGWPVDLTRYNGLADMYIDYVRVYQGKN